MITFLLIQQLLVLFLIKETSMTICGLVSIRKKCRLDGALWCGKVATTVFYICMVLLILFPSIGQPLADILLLVTAAGILIRTHVDAIRIAGRATQGVIVMRFKEEGDQVISLALAEREEEESTTSEENVENQATAEPETESNPES